MIGWANVRRDDKEDSRMDTWTDGWKDIPTDFFFACEVHIKVQST